MLRTVVEVPMLTVLDTREPLALRRAIALELLRHEPPGDVLTAFEELAEELLGRLLVAPPLHEDVEHYAVLIHRPPQRGALLVHTDKHLEDVSEVLVCYSLGTYESQSNPLLIE